MQAGYTLYVRVHSYQNPSNKCSLCKTVRRPVGCCDNFSNPRTCTGRDRCDETFYYCLRNYRTVSALTANPKRCGEHDRMGKLSGVNIDSKEIDFSQSSALGLPNPIPLRGITFQWKVHNYTHAV